MATPAISAFGLNPHDAVVTSNGSLSFKGLLDSTTRANSSHSGVSMIPSAFRTALNSSIPNELNSKEIWASLGPAAVAVVVLLVVSVLFAGLGIATWCVALLQDCRLFVRMDF